MYQLLWSTLIIKAQVQSQRLHISSSFCSCSRSLSEIEGKKKKISAETDNYVSWTKCTFCSNFKIFFKNLETLNLPCWLSHSSTGSRSGPCAGLRSGQTVGRYLSRTLQTEWAGAAHRSLHSRYQRGLRASTPASAVYFKLVGRECTVGSQRPGELNLQLLTQGKTWASLPTAKVCGLGFFCLVGFVLVCFVLLLIIRATTFLM